MTSSQVVETSVSNNSSFQNYPNPDYWYSGVQTIYKNNYVTEKLLYSEWQRQFFFNWFEAVRLSCFSV